MNGSNSRWRAPGRRPLAMMAGALLAAGLAAACSSAGSSSTAASGATSGATSAAASSAAGGGSAGGGAAAAGACGTTVPVGPSNPTGVYASMPASLKSIYSSYPNELIQSPWATTKITAKAPWKIGFIAFAITNPYNQDVLTGLQQQFAIAKQAGLVTGSLVTNIPATMAASTAEQQISAIQQMVSQGINAIILLPVDSVAEAPAINAAGKAGVPVILADTPPAPNTPYAVSAWSQNQVQADAGALGLIKSGNIIMVKGIAGNENDVVLYNQAIADLKNCPNIHVAATLYGNWDNGTAKTVVAQYIASHPQPLAGAIQDGGMMSGVIQAFQSTGATVPTIADGECGGGDLSWWLAHKSSYQTVGGCFNGFQGAYTYMDVTLRVLDNKGPKYNVLEMPTPAITNSNLSTFAKPGLPLSSTEEVGGPQTAWCDDACLNKYFTVTGAATS
jgi:ribose transport system substrate-binding protein